MSYLSVIFSYLSFTRQLFQWILVTISSHDNNSSYTSVINELCLLNCRITNIIYINLLLDPHRASFQYVTSLRYQFLDNRDIPRTDISKVSGGVLNPCYRIAIAFMFNGGSTCGSTIHPIDTKICILVWTYIKYEMCIGNCFLTPWVYIARIVTHVR